MNTLTQEQLFELAITKREYLLKTVGESITFKLKKSLSRETLEDLVSDATTELLVRNNEGKVSFATEQKAIGYILFSCWCNYRNQHVTTNKKQKGFHYLEDMPLYAATLESEATPEETEQDKADTYYAQYFDKVFTYLDDCVADGYFSFRDVGIFKLQVLNGYNIRETATHSDFSYDICALAIRTIRQHLKTVDFRMTKPQ